MIPDFERNSMGGYMAVEEGSSLRRVAFFEVSFSIMPEASFL